eukprot:scaffold31178_cov154-Skeletonema_menzelii.AAC.6
MILPSISNTTNYKQMVKLRKYLGTMRWGSKQSRTDPSVRHSDDKVRRIDLRLTKANALDLRSTDLFSFQLSTGTSALIELA